MTGRAQPHAKYEVVIGLEVHVHLRTESKLFSPAPVRYGDPPNHDVHPLDLGLPGVLPVLNRRAVELGIRAALATHCKVHPQSVFARKNYFYPDLPKGYQISQFEEPLATGGWIEIECGDGASRKIGLTRIHIEEDAGKSIHDSAVASAEGSHIDLNRAGVPLLEIVSEPDLRSPEEAAAYLRKLRAILRWADVSDADMEKGQFRCDANVSLRVHGAPQLGTRTELKNLNSFRFVEEAIWAEIHRQAELLDAGGAVVQATMHYDEGRRTTRVMRLKENSDDYRYFPDPDLVPLVIAEAEIDAVRAALPELPEDRRARFEREHGLSAYDARLLTESRALADFYEAAAQSSGHAKAVANWMLRDVLAQLKEQGRDIDETALAPDALAKLVALVEGGRVTAASARPLLAELMERGGDPEALVRERGLEAVSDTGLLEAAADEVIAANAAVADQVRAGEEKGLNFLMGQVMKRTQGKANPKAVREILARKLRG
ncbi:MAG: Asp-tRNA(Asn)/Glu-tRNA(Gln) amidotransferase GatCAB subunit B [Proteobacteria bacterium]|nr:MAG: Asp-tRNA(Asn)/Glu-tRNA(Gln) amidotransferase GatCAB subunit B [Pseudomonadota bacterium]